MSSSSANGFGSYRFGSWSLVALLLMLRCSVSADAQQVTFTSQPLTTDQDLASEMVDGLDRFLLHKLEESKTKRERHWSQLGDDAEALASARIQLTQMLGMTENRMPVKLTYEHSWLHGSDEGPLADISMQLFTWPVLSDPVPGRESLCSLHGAGLILRKKNATPIGTAIAIPDTGVSPEDLVGLRENELVSETWALGLAQAGYQVIVPSILSRKSIEGRRKNTLDQREYLYRSAYELGKTLTGYEVHKILGIVDVFGAFAKPLIVVGQGEGGRLALLAGALSTKIHATAIIGHFGPRQRLWEESLDRNVFGLLNQFDDSELTRLIAPRKLIIGDFGYREFEITGQGGRAPSRVRAPDRSELKEELEQARSHFSDAKFVTVKSWKDLFAALPHSPDLSPKLTPTKRSDKIDQFIISREKQQFLEVERHNQTLLHESAAIRRKFLGELDFSSVEAYEESTKKYRAVFRDKIIGAFGDKMLPANPRSRKTWETEKWTGYEIQLDVFPDVFAYGVLLLPKDLKPGERRPVVVCQHGLEGRPTDTFQDDHRAYHDFAAKLCDRGFIVFAPQNPYIFGDRFRTLQRKANLLGKTLFSLIVLQHQQITDWLQTLDFVDPDRIAFYGLSYGGKSAMRIPALLDDYCLSICSADFNEWVLKNASTRHDFSYVWTGEYEIFEWNLGNNFNYFEMAALICPRPFMVERGHFDGVGRDEWVAFEYAKVRHLYAAQLQIPDRTEIEWFRGPHTINGQGTFDFLHRHLQFRSPDVGR